MRNYRNINSMYICSSAGVCMHMIVYIQYASCVYARIRTWRRYSAGGLGFVMAWRQKCLLASRRSDKVGRTDLSAAFSHHPVWFRWNLPGQVLFFPRAWSAVAIFAASPPFLPAVLGFLHFNSLPLSLPLTTWIVSLWSLCLETVWILCLSKA